MSLESDKAEASKIIHGLEGDLHAIEHEIHRLLDHVFARTESPVTVAATVEPATAEEIQVAEVEPVAVAGPELAPEAPNL